MQWLTRNHHRKKAAGQLGYAFEVFDAVLSGQADMYHSPITIFVVSTGYYS
jgi:TRAP-type mannitol/chloroaromatic compound transport system substrate-binding protein